LPLNISADPPLDWDGADIRAPPSCEPLIPPPKLPREEPPDGLPPPRPWAEAVSIAALLEINTAAAMINDFKMDCFIMCVNLIYDVKSTQRIMRALS
jgi:hypothetical protein